ncbi:hypothetical protein [Guptibacillus hwajinpoensis]|uniref:Lipoprotein n=1 Tax=Guptibacillus hwajinpoensis TaxID=208199 RepID=A0A0J6CP55_9BACL|nr:hypothetical protein [Alkalihalobacillus macyae]KMM38026.1 hypothetical protein AB986_01480 [Alkalihalobacillus macyae]
MKRFIILVGVVLLLVSCTSHGSSQTKSSSSLEIEPADLSEREKIIVNQTGVDYQTFYTIDGEVNEGDVLETSIEVYEKGEGKVMLSSTSIPGDNTKHKENLNSFQILMEEEVSYFTIGDPNGYVRGNEFIPDNLVSFSFVHLEEKITITKDEPVYLSYLIGTSQNELSAEGNEDVTSLPKSVSDAEYAVVFKLELKNASDK